MTSTDTIYRNGCKLNNSTSCINQGPFLEVIHYNVNNLTVYLFLLVKNFNLKKKLIWWLILEKSKYDCREADLYSCSLTLYEYRTCSSYPVSACLYFPWCNQQEQKLCGLCCSEVLAAQRYSGREHYLWQPFQQTKVNTPGAVQSTFVFTELFAHMHCYPEAETRLNQKHCS